MSRFIVETEEAYRQYISIARTKAQQHRDEAKRSSIQRQIADQQLKLCEAEKERINSLPLESNWQRLANEFTKTYRSIDPHSIP